jgi:hypothetical protein
MTEKSANRCGHGGGLEATEAANWRAWRGVVVAAVAPTCQAKNKKKKVKPVNLLAGSWLLAWSSLSLWSNALDLPVTTEDAGKCDRPVGRLSS